MAKNLSPQPPIYKSWVHKIRAQIRQHIEQNLHLYCSPTEAPKWGEVVFTNAPRPKRYTVIFEIALRSKGGVCQKKIIAKSYHRNPARGTKLNDHDLANKCEREFQAHQQVYSSFQTQPREFAVVKPLAYLPEILCLTIEKAPGRDLATLIHRAKHKLVHFDREQEQLGKHFERAGQWLAIFHRGFAQGESDRFEAAKLEAQVQWCVERMARAGVAAPYLQSITRQFKKVAAEFQGQPLPQTQLHGDLKPCHLFATKNRVIGIDFGNMMAGFGLEDVARMLAEIKLIDLGWDASRRGGLTDHLQRKFVLGYLGEESMPRLLSLYYAYWLCAKWTRRLYKHRWMSHALVRRTDSFFRPAAIQSFINRKFISPWFSALLANVLETIEKGNGLLF